MMDISAVLAELLDKTRVQDFPGTMNFVTHPRRPFLAKEETPVVTALHNAT
jgi:hypothetical protein